MSADSTRLSLNVLVAEDDEDMRALIVETLRSDGHHVTEASDGADLLVRLREGIRSADKPAVIVTDVLMPNLSGLGVLATLHRAGCHIPVILITGLADESVLTVAKRFGHVTFFKKPVDIDKLREAVVDAHRF
jgi:CheY-like chemotaxis protein